MVVDASVAVKWLVEEIYSRQADNLLAAWDQDNTRIAGPHLLPVEVSNALYKRVRQHQIALDTAVQLEAEFLGNAIELMQSASLPLTNRRPKIPTISLLLNPLTVTTGQPTSSFIMRQVPTTHESIGSANSNPRIPLAPEGSVCF